MLTTADALAKILASMPEFPAVAIDAASATGRTLRQPVIAERDQPPFDRVMMDGIAIAYAAGASTFPIQCTQMAGEPAAVLEAGKCIEVMTGASLPEGADCIIPVEHIDVTDGVATLEDGYTIEERQCIHPRGSDHVAGAQLLSPGKRIAPADIAVIASAGLTSVEVSAIPRVAIVSTGNELVPAGMPIESHQVRLSNGPAIAAMLASHGIGDCYHDHIIDERDVLRDRLAAHLDASDALILSGGVSMGKADFVPEVLAGLDVEVVFHKVSQRPGKPMWFGVAPGGKPVFALPGNPVSALVCCRQYIVPALDRAALAVESPPEFASLAGDVTFKPELTCYQPVKLISNAVGQLLAMPVRTNTSGDFTALSGTDGYVELAAEQTHFPTGTSARVYRW